MGGNDAYVNLAGGMRLSEPAIDLGIVVALVSSYKNVPVDSNMIIFGEIGLAGEVRGVSMAVQRVREAAKMGFTTCMLPKINCEGMEQIEGMKLIGVQNIAEVIAYI